MSAVAGRRIVPSRYDARGCRVVGVAQRKANNNNNNSNNNHTQNNNNNKNNKTCCRGG